MKDPFKEVGIGVISGEFRTFNAIMSTQDFAYRGGNSFLTGVALAPTPSPTTTSTRPARAWAR